MGIGDEVDEEDEGENSDYPLPITYYQCPMPNAQCPIPNTLSSPIF
ncbi:MULTISPECIES: histidine kinase [unclassified Tolypothrix]|nr:MULTISPECIES: histidine kinase [unclassified Tolypothrix]MBE9088082.1 histidine kinase [Tolypothrix sp. LEGE 11397]UYD28342.1 histidine kinase [Tolypothrix sp. PCC 7712]UYD35783.1 histidine kinase [Tolypothrix sp. PCC 7601]